MVNKLQFDILWMLKEKTFFNSADYSRTLLKAPDIVTGAYHELERGGWIQGSSLTDKAENVLEEHKVDNAVILAAGMSTPVSLL